jgi:uncharacterized protein (TIGR02598 family)
MKRVEISRPDPAIRFNRFSGFSLVEVVLAIGIVSFALLTIIGLLTISLSASRGAAEDTNLALMSPTVASVLNAQGFTSVMANTAYAATAATPAYYFDINNEMTRDGNGNPISTPNANSIYACTITRRTPVLFQATSNIVYLQLKFTWPLTASANSRQQKIVFTSVANYN